MATINSQILFLTTSPRTPEKMIPEIDLLATNFSGLKWSHKVQCEFMDVLRNETFFNGKGENDAAFSARDRINRAPKSLGFVKLNPVISLTPAGEALLSSRRKGEVFLRQMLKFQIPSPFHRPTEKATTFCVKPYLEILRLVRTMGTLKFDELRLFGMQLTDWHKFDEIVQKIETFRKAKLDNKGSYRRFYQKYTKAELKQIFSERIAMGKTKTRESKDKSLDNFFRTQSNNMRDYADACFRYLRATELVNVSHVGKSLSIIPERLADVDFILKTVEREPLPFTTEDDYINYLGDIEIPRLYTDDKDILVQRIKSEFPDVAIDPFENAARLKDILAENIEIRKEEEMVRQVKEIKNYKFYDDIQNIFRQIVANELYDNPLMLEWNTWRAMTMLDGGEIKANLKFDDFGKPLSTAQGNMADIVCDYGDFNLIVEVTMASGQKQYEMECEPISRHLGKMKKSSHKPCYCLFVSPTINEATIAHCFGLHHLNISFYGGKSIIVPLPLEIFQKMLEDSYKACYTPNSNQVKRFFERSMEIVGNGCNEVEWYDEMKKVAVNWLT